MEFPALMRLPIYAPVTTHLLGFLIVWRNKPEHTQILSIAPVGWPYRATVSVYRRTQPHSRMEKAKTGRHRSRTFPEVAPVHTPRLETYRLYCDRERKLLRKLLTSSEELWKAVRSSHSRAISHCQAINHSPEISHSLHLDRTFKINPNLPLT